MGMKILAVEEIVYKALMKQNSSDDEVRELEDIVASQKSVGNGG